MKKLSIMIMALALVLGMAQCKKQTEQQSNEPAGATMDVTVRVQGNTEKTGITSAGVVTWKQGDKLYVVGESQGLLGYVSAKADGDPATFSGSITALTSAQTLRFYYVGDKSFTLNGDDYTFDISSQDGSLAGIAANNQLMWGKTTSTIAVGAIDFGTIEMTSLMSIAHLSIKDGNAAVAGPVAVTGGFATSTFNAKTYDGTTLSGTADDITMTFPEGTASTNCYLALLPGTQTLNFSADGKEATVAAKTIAANKFYNADNAYNAVEVAVTTPTHEYVDLGLSVKWATCNVGADSPEGYGDYFAWGEILPYYADGYSQESPCTHWRESMTTGAGNTVLTSGYAWKSYSQGGSSIFAEWTTPPYDATTKILKSDYDAATADWGSGWRMPTKEEWKALYDNTTNAWTDNFNNTGVAGRVFTSKTDSSKFIFLPAAGYRNGTSLSYAGSGGYYWSSSLSTDSPNDAYFMYFYSGGVHPQDGSSRCNGFSVRPVR